MRIIKSIGIRLLCIALGLVCLLLLVQPALADQAVEKTHIHTYTANVHRRASEDSIIIGQIEHGDSVTVLEQSGDYYKIDCFGLTGFIAKSMVEEISKGNYVVNCSVESAKKDIFLSQSLNKPNQLLRSILTLCREQLGVPYIYGGTTPSGFDCSGFVSYVFGNHDIPLHRCADEQMQDGLIVAKEDLKAGDLVFFRIYGPWLASHVGIYVGNGTMIHAGSQGIGFASLDNEYWQASYVGARRMLSLGKTAREITAFSNVATPTAVWEANENN